MLLSYTPIILFISCKVLTNIKLFSVKTDQITLTIKAQNPCEI